MPDLEKISRGLQAIHDEAYDRWVHTQYTTDKLVTLVSEVVPDAIAMLAEQEPVKPIEFHNSFRNGSRIDYFCGNCTTQVGMSFSNEDAWRFHYHFCPRCGKKVDWDA